MRHKHCLPWNMVRKLKNVENDRQTLQDLEYGEKSDQRENRETHMVGPGTRQETVKNLKNEICTQQDLYMPRKSKMGKIRLPHCRKMEYLENNDKRGKGDINTVGLGIS